MKLKNLFLRLKPFKYYLQGKSFYKDTHYNEVQKKTILEVNKKPSRTEIINYLLSLNKNEKSYLEIGVRNPEHNFNHIKADSKYSVDPGVELISNPVDYKMTSDVFFQKLAENEILHNDIKFDVIFIDGLHLAEQVDRDVDHALNYIKDDGFIVLHDCNPPSEWHARENYTYCNTPAHDAWNGTTWKAFLKWRFNPSVNSCCIDSDWGVGIISKSHQIGKNIHPVNPFFEFNDLATNRKKYLNLIDFDTFKNTIMKALILLLFVCISSHMNAQESGTKGTEFWLAYMENLTLAFNGDPQFSIYVSAEESGDATITAASTGLTYSFSYEANTITEFTFPPSILYATGSEEIKNFGFRINTSNQTAITAVHHRIFFTEASIVLPSDILGDEYHIIAGKDFNNSFNSPSSFVIVATEDNTEIEITPSANTAELRPAGIPFTITMNAGNTYQVQALGDLTGSKIRSLNNSNLAIFSGAQQADISCNLFADNHLYEQALPISYGAKKYALIPFKDQGFSLFKFLALEDDTEIYINGTLFATLQSGEFLDQLYDEAKILTSNKNIFVSQFNLSQGCTESQLGDPTMIHLHSSDYRIRDIYFENLFGFSGSTQAFAKQNITLFTETENTSDITIDNVNISGEFEEFPENPMYSFATLTLDIGTSHLEAPRGVFAYCYGFGDFDAYSYILGFDPNSEVSVSDINQNNISIYPNPVTNQINISFSEIIETIELLTIDGKCLHSTSTNSKESSINLQEIPRGVYVLKIHSNNNIYFRKIVKQ